jgi:hypothetical protein
MTISSLGLTGGWEEVFGNYARLPPVGSRIKGVVYFMGGFFFGAVPQVTYRTLCDQLVQKGYVVVACPYQLDGFDYEAIARGIVMRMRAADAWVDGKLSERGMESSAIPQFAVGHSCGALMHYMIELYHPELAKKRTGGCALISFNNKNATDAIPGLNEFVAPLSSALYTEVPTLSGAPSVGDAIGLRYNQLRDAVRSGLESASELPFVAPIVKNELLPLEQQIAPVLGQVGPLLQSVAKTDRNFTPTAAELTLKAEESYNAPRTLLVQFENDTLDETPTLQTTLAGVDRLDGTVQCEILTGTHFTPLTQDPLPLDGDLTPDAQALAQAINSLSGGFDQQIRSAALSDYERLATVLNRWLDQGVDAFEAASAASAEEPASEEEPATEEVEEEEPVEEEHPAPPGELDAPDDLEPCA